jgi:diguanylate cyclase (GGDEF)-like protein
MVLNGIKRMLSTTAATIKAAHLISEGLDYKTLSRYILRITSLCDTDAILREASRCFLEILDYELFGFALDVDRKLEVWIDPKPYKGYILGIIERDFQGRYDARKIHYLESRDADAEYYSEGMDFGAILSYPVKISHHVARLYVLPKRRMLSYHDEIINIIVSTMTSTLENAEKLRHLENAATLDPLTGCYNRRGLDINLAQDVATAKRYGGELSLIMFDIDHFKKVNDTHGHDVGDLVLKATADEAADTVRKCDYIGRYGGEEFLIVLPDTGLASAVALAERLRVRIGSNRVSSVSGEVCVTASFGVGQYRDGLDLRRLIKSTDEMLYRAKTSGRDRVMPSPAVHEALALAI